MLDIFVFITQQFFNIFLFLDNIEIYGALTFLRFLIIITLTTYVVKVVRG